MKVGPSSVTINGSHGEGGSALLRTALVMSALTQQPLRIHGIRGATRTPGITHEDLTLVRMLEQATNALLEGDSLTSSELSFAPQRAPVALHGSFDIQGHERLAAPGNALVVLQSIMPVLARTRHYSRINLHGETFNNNAMSYDAFALGTLPANRRQGLYGFAELHTGGFGYAGKGEVSLEVEPSAMNGIDWTTRGELIGVTGQITYCELQDSIADRAMSHLENSLRKAGFEADVDVRKVRSKSPGIYVTIAAEFERGIGTGGAMGAKGVRVESVVNQALQPLLQWIGSGANTDPYIADQLLIPAVLSDGPSAWKTSAITRRLITMAWVVKQFIPIQLTILGREGEPGTIKLSR